MKFLSRITSRARLRAHARRSVEGFALACKPRGSRPALSAAHRAEVSAVADAFMADFRLYPRDWSLYAEAFTHSVLGTMRGAQRLDNERLELLGDTALDTAVTEGLMTRHPDAREGELTLLRSRLTNRHTLNRLGEDLGIPLWLRLPERSNVVRSADIAGNALEALVGALLLDRGYPAVRAWVEREVFGRIDLAELSQSTTDFKSRLLIACQKHHHAVEWLDDFERPADDGRTFFGSKVRIDGCEVASGTGYTKKEAQQNASRAALLKGVG